MIHWTWLLLVVPVSMVLGVVALLCVAAINDRKILAPFDDDPPLGI